MRYSKAQINAVANEMRKRLVSGEVEGHEIVVALVSMEKSGRITPVDIRNILLHVFSNDIISIIKALQLAEKIISPEMIDNIIKEVEERDNTSPH